MLGLIVARFTALISIILRLIIELRLRSCVLSLFIYKASGISAITKCHRWLQPLSGSGQQISFFKQSLECANFSDKHPLIKIIK